MQALQAGPFASLTDAPLLRKATPSCSQRPLHVYVQTEHISIQFHHQSGYESRIRVWHIRRVLVPVVLFLSGIIARFPVISTPPYGDEAAHFSVAGSLWKTTSIVHDVYFDWFLNYAVIFWQRPMHYLALAPFSQDFTAFRVANAVVSALVPVLVYMVIRQAASWRVALLLSIPLVVHPSLVIFGVRGFADTWMVFWILLALHQRNHSWQASLFLLVAVWTKETGIVALAAFVLWFVWEHRGQSVGVERAFLPLATAIILAPIPFAISMAMGQQFPGWTHGGNPFAMLDVITGSIWLVPVILLALWKKWSLPVLLSLAFPAFYALYAWKTGLAPQAWYATASIPLAAVGIGYGCTKLPFPRRGAIVAGIILVLPAIATGMVASAVNPISEGLPLWQGYDVANNEGSEYVALTEWLSEQDVAGLVAVDVPWFFFEYPLSQHATSFHFSYSHVVDYFAWDHQALTTIMQQPGHLTVLHETQTPTGFHAQLRDHFQTCQIQQFGPLHVYEGALCEPYEAQLQS